MLDVKVVLPGKVGGFTVRECGIIDDEGDLIAVCNMPDAEKAIIEDGISAALTIIMHIVMTNGDALEFTLDPTIDAASAVSAAFTILQDAWEFVEEEDESGYFYTADVPCDEATAAHTPIVTLDKRSLAGAGACGLCPTVETVSGALRFWAVDAPNEDLHGTVLLVSHGGGSGGDGNYVLPAATQYRLGGVKIGDGLVVDKEGTLSVDAANTEETTGALDEVFGAQSGE